MRTDTALRKMREICLSLEGVHESAHFGEAAFRVGKKMFATCGEKDGICRICFGLEPDHADALLDSDPRYKRYGRAQARSRTAPAALWIDAADVTDWKEIRALVAESYRLQAPKRPPATRGARATAARRR